MLRDIKLSVVAVFAALYMILPSYFAIEFSSSLPLITASRILLLLLVVVYLIKNNWHFNFKIINESSVNRLLLAFFALIFITDIGHLPSSSAIRDILSVIIEEWLVVWVLTTVIVSPKSMKRFLRVDG